VIDAGKGIAVSRSTITGQNIINAVMNPGSECTILENESSDEEIVTEKIFWAKAADACSALLKISESRPCYSAQEITQLHTLLSNFLEK
jgi:hypothetical protein